MPAGTWRGELRRLLDAAATSPKTIRRRTGPDRYHLYLLAAATGFRAGELASLQPEAFDLGGDLPTVTVEKHLRQKPQGGRPAVAHHWYLHK
jgi:integrase